MKIKTKDFIIIGFALFSMFFGAGNLIFPPFLGRELGDQYLIGMLGFIVTGVGIPLLGILSCVKIKGNFEELSLKVGKNFSFIYSIALFLLIGPLLAIPRTAATTFELAIAPNFIGFKPIIFIIIYFLINLFFVLRPSSVIETIGKFLTPILLTVLLLLIVKGILSPLGNLTTNAIDGGALSSSLIEGYQTMDALASIVFASLIITTIKSKGYTGKSITSVAVKASIVAVIGLTIVYGGLLFLGAHTSTLTESLSKTELLIYLSKSVLGSLGSVVIGVAIGVACLTTSIGLLSSGGSFFERVSNGKLKYNFNVIFMAVVSTFIASLGVDKIVSFSGNLLNIIYPISILLILMNLLDKFIPNKKSYKFTIYTTLIISVLNSLGQFLPNSLGSVMSKLPLSNLGFEWIIPAILILIISNLIPLLLKKNSINESIEA